MQLEVLYICNVKWIKFVLSCLCFDSKLTFSFSAGVYVKLNKPNAAIRDAYVALEVGACSFICASADCTWSVNLLLAT